jgi:hypothetical protein
MTPRAHSRLSHFLRSSGLAKFRGSSLKLFFLHSDSSKIHPGIIFRDVRLVLRLSSFLSQRSPQNSAKPAHLNDLSLKDYVSVSSERGKASIFYPF